MSYIDGAPFRRVRNLLIDPPVSSSGDPLWDNVWLLLPLDTLAQGDVSNNAFAFDRAIAPAYSSLDALGDVLASAAKWGDAGWSCHRNVGAGEGSMYQTTGAFSGHAAADRTFGTEVWCAETWCFAGDNSQPVGSSQRRLQLVGALTGSTQTIELCTVEGRLKLFISQSLTGTVLLSAETVGVLTDEGGGLFTCESSAAVLTDDVFSLIAAMYDGTFLRLTCDGVIVFQCSATIDLDDPWLAVTVGSSGIAFGGIPLSVASGPAVGSSAVDAIDDVRVTLGADRYTTFPYDVPSAAFPIG